MVGGGLAGMAYWGPVYPLDVIKSRMQVDDLKNPQYRGMMDCFRKVKELSMLGHFAALKVLQSPCSRTDLSVEVPGYRCYSRSHSWCSAHNCCLASHA